jgi:hypothetical protein
MLPKATVVVMALKITALVRLDCSKPVLPARHKISVTGFLPPLESMCGIRLQLVTALHRTRRGPTSIFVARDDAVLAPHR